MNSSWCPRGNGQLVVIIIHVLGWKSEITNLVYNLIGFEIQNQLRCLFLRGVCMVLVMDVVPGS